MRLTLLSTAGLICATALSGCASNNYANSWQEACMRDYQRNRAAAAAAGAVLGGAAGAAVANDDRAGAAIGAAAGGLIGHQLAKKDDPCGYGFGGYPYDRSYGYWDDRRGYWRR